MHRPAHKRHPHGFLTLDLIGPAIGFAAVAMIVFVAVSWWKTGADQDRLFDDATQVATSINDLHEASAKWPISEGLSINAAGRYQVQFADRKTPTSLEPYASPGVRVVDHLATTNGFCFVLALREDLWARYRSDTATATVFAKPVTCSAESTHVTQ